MPNRIQFVRHLEADANDFEGLEGEVTVNLSNFSLRVHNGEEPGGNEVARADLQNAPAATTGSDGKATSVQIQQLTTNTADIATLQNDVVVEVADRIAGDSVLQGQITTNDAEIAVLQGETSTLQTQVTANDADILSLQTDKADKLVVPVDTLFVADASGNLANSGYVLDDLNSKVCTVSIGTGGQLYPSGSVVDILLEQEEHKDIASMHSNVTNAERLIVPTGGYTLARVCGQFRAGSAGWGADTRATVHMYINGLSAVYPKLTDSLDLEIFGGGYFPVGSIQSDWFPVVAGDYVHFTLYQNTGLGTFALAPVDSWFSLEVKKEFS